MTIETTVINPRVIFVSALQPQDVTEGKLWYDTTTSKLLVSDGSKYISMETDLTQEDKLIQENALNILVNSASATSTLNDWDNMILDRFTDADGQLNTVDTTNTTATFDTNLYKNTLSSSLKNNIVSYYSLDGNTNDETGNYNGTNNGATQTTGKINGAYSFNGSNNYIDISNISSSNSDFTASVWFYENSNSNSLNSALSFGQNTGAFNEKIFQ